MTWCIEGFNRVKHVLLMIALLQLLLVLFTLTAWRLNLTKTALCITALTMLLALSLPLYLSAYGVKDRLGLVLLLLYPLQPLAYSRIFKALESKTKTCMILKLSSVVLPFLIPLYIARCLREDVKS